MRKNTIVVLGVAAASLLTATGPAAADDYVSITSCPATVTAGTGVTPPSLLDTAEARQFLQTLARTDGRSTSLYVASDPAFVQAAQFPGMLDTLLLTPEAEPAPLAAPGAPPQARDILEPLVADAMGCAPASQSLEAGSAPPSLLDAAGATSVLEALMNRPEACVSTGPNGTTVTTGRTTVTADPALLDSIGVRRTLDLLVGRTSACATPRGATVAVSSVPGSPGSLLDDLGLADFLDNLFG